MLVFAFHVCFASPCGVRVIKDWLLRCVWYPYETCQGPSFLNGFNPYCHLISPHSDSSASHLICSWSFEGECVKKKIQRKCDSDFILKGELQVEDPAGQTESVDLHVTDRRRVGFIFSSCIYLHIRVPERSLLSAVARSGRMGNNLSRNNKKQ